MGIVYSKWTKMSLYACCNFWINDLNATYTFHRLKNARAKNLREHHWSS